MRVKVIGKMAWPKQRVKQGRARGGGLRPRWWGVCRDSRFGVEFFWVNEGRVGQLDEFLGLFWVLERCCIN